MTIHVYGIPTCSTCKKALKWLKESDIRHEWHNTREKAPTKKEIAGWVKDIGFAPLRNTSGGSYRAIGEEKKSWGDEEWIAAFSRDAMLLKRPVFVRDGSAMMTGFRGSPEDIRRKIGLD